MSYEIVNKFENEDGSITQTVKVGEKYFKVGEQALALAELAIAGGGNAEQVFGLLASKESKVKEFDADKAAKVEEKSRLAKAIESLKAEIAGHEFSDEAKAAADGLADARRALEDAKETYNLIDLSVYVETSGGPSEGEYRWAMYPVKGEKTFSLVLSLGNEHPLHMAMTDLSYCEEVFRNSVANELGKVIPQSLREHVKTLNADVDGDGNISIAFDVKERKTRNVGGKRNGRQVRIGDMVFVNATEAGKHLADKEGKDVKYPHKLTEAAIKAGTASYVEG